MDYFLVLWKYKWLIFLCSVLPALIVGLIFFFTPRSYKITYVYDLSDDVRDDTRNDLSNNLRDDVSSWNLSEKKYNILLSRFYSAENLNKIANKLKEKSLIDYAKQIASGRQKVKDLIKFEPFPAFIDNSKIKI